MEMICTCGKYGIYWRELHTGNPYTYCPHCLHVNCHTTTNEDQESDYSKKFYAKKRKCFIEKQV